MAGVITYRNMFLQVLWMILTMGFYAVYWFHVVSREMADYLRRDEPVALWTVFLFVPPLFFYSYYKQGELFESVTAGNVNRWLTLALWILFPPGVWFIVQLKLNELAKEAEQRAKLGAA